MTIQHLPATKIGPTRFSDRFYRSGQKYGNHDAPHPAMTGRIQAHILVLRFEPGVRGFLLMGDTGVGKTHLLINAATSIPNTAVMLLPGSMFGSKHEGGMVENFEAAMADAVAYSAYYRCYVVVIIDDIDATELSISENTGHTTNAISFAGHLQTLLNSPQLHVDFSGRPIPLLFSANDPSKIRESLLRFDRVTRDVLVVDADVRYRLVMLAFDPQGTTETKIVEKLIRANPHQSMAFWNALAKAWHAYQVQIAIREYGPDQSALERARKKRAPLDAKVLAHLAKTAREATLRNHFQPKRTGLFG